MIFKKIALFLMAVVMVFSLASCQLSQYFGNETGKNDGTDNSTGAESQAQLEDFIPDGVDVNYVMDYLNEDLSAYITLGQYKDLSVTVSTYEVNDALVEESINDLLESKSEPAKITDRKTAEGDTICVDYTGYLDGVAFAGGSATDVMIDLVENSGYIPGFTDGMYDVMPGETVSYDVTFPEIYQNNPDLAGKKTVFTVTIHYIEGDLVPPLLDDEFVKANFGEAGCETVEQFKAYYKSLLENERAELLKEDATYEIWDQIMNNVTLIQLPEKSVDAIYWYNRATYELYAKQYGVEYEDFLALYVGMSDEQIREQAESYIKEDLAIYSIVKAEGIEVTEEELAEGIKTYSEEYQMTEEELVATYSEQKIVSVLQWHKLMKAIYEWNSVEETIG